MFKLYFFGFILICLTSLEALAQCGASINLGTWTQEGPASNGAWIVDATGNSVNQFVNGPPTFFVSPDEFIDVRIKGKL
ncbi:MAG: hypothetical protein MRY83_11825, partial [Flavobacteriales bacterium]|nr:hypothetical protein [Flavobacteriales bacterium]